MEKYAKEALQVSKEIVVKFIESGRVSPANFAEVFPAVHQVVLRTITRPGERAPLSDPEKNGLAKAFSGKSAAPAASHEQAEREGQHK